MRYEKRFRVWQDRISGQCYSRKYAFRPVVMPTADGAVVSGHVYAPCHAPDNADFEALKGLWEHADERVGYPAGCFGQSLFVADADLQERFDDLGEAVEVCDTQEQIRSYEDECCDFSDKEWVAGLALSNLERMGGQSQCVWASVLKPYVEGLPASPEGDELRKRLES